MTVETISFIALFLPISLVLYYLAIRSVKIQNGLLILASLFFYGFGSESLWAVILLLLVIGWNWLGGFYLEKQQTKFRLAMIVAVNVGIFSGVRLLALPALTTELSLPTIIVPLGMAWFILQGIGYCMEIYLGEVKAERNIMQFSLYMLFFPKLIHGPLIDFPKMKEQMIQRTFTIDGFTQGLQRFIVGLAKKMLIADQFAYVINYAFVQTSIDSTVTQPPVLLIWFALLANGIYLYFSLSGYADMAIGMAKMFGFQLPENFREPFVATSLTDFWKRWNITVIRWFRKYFLGFMNRNSNRDQITINLFITWLLIGIWMGFDWNFVFWGAFNFVILISEHFFSFSERVQSILFRRIYTTLLVLVGFIFLRSQSLYHTGQFLGDLFWLNNNPFYSAQVGVFIKELWLPLIVAVFVMFIHPIIKEKDSYFDFEKYASVLRIGKILGMICLYLLCLLLILLNFNIGQVLN
ncbi:MBOAT family protein [Enterococcus saccharolyticus]|uniref:MBOAT family O-acyltransferase n=1 Tax=Enterococcus saccharolyticus TaxID=41997 RepID=UPI001E537D14|nr:MBOAT family O-acyltransferase [Enterococcus saccharolyticus]MCD5002548.1 MBOAT family protein [Enterococcus saccharolyticus]